MYIFLDHFSNLVGAPFEQFFLNQMQWLAYCSFFDKTARMSDNVPEPLSHFNVLKNLPQSISTQYTYSAERTPQDSVICGKFVETFIIHW